MVERSAHNRLVAGSIPAGPTVILDDNLPDNVMERESPETDSEADYVGREPEAAKYIGFPPTFFDSIYRQTRIIDSMRNPAINRLLSGMSLRFPNPKIVDAIRGQTQVFDKIDRHIAGVIAPSAQLAKFAQISAQFQAAVNGLSPLINRILTDAFIPVREISERFGKASRVQDAFLHYSLWIAPSMSEELVAKIVNLYESGASSATVHSVVSRYYAKDDWQRLEEVLERCRNNPLFKSRIKVFEDALRAHREGLYSLSVPGLLIHLEGIAADYVKKHKLLPQVGRKTKEIILTALEDTPYSLLDIRTYAGVGALIEYVEYSMFASVDFDKEHVRLHSENKLQGHAVRHGRQIAVGSRMNSLRLFLFIDVMALLKD